jgi:hypothetical protein
MQTEGSAIASVRRAFEAAAIPVCSNVATDQTSNASAKERENGNLSYCDPDRAFPIVKYTNKKQKEKNL